MLEWRDKLSECKFIKSLTIRLDFLILERKRWIGERKVVLVVLSINTIVCQFGKDFEASSTKNSNSLPIHALPFLALCFYLKNLIAIKNAIWIKGELDLAHHIDAYIPNFFFQHISQ